MCLCKELEKTQKRHTDDENPLQGLTDSQILKLGQAALRKNTPSEKTIEKPAAKQEPFLAALSVIFFFSEIKSVVFLFGAIFAE